MCGILGSITHRDVPLERLERGLVRMRHRGPDDSGTYRATPAYLGACRLAIIDLSPAGHMPMLSDDGQTAVVFNGEIYNFAQLRGELEPRFRFRSGSDTEVILHGYHAWGWEGMLQRIDGMFAIALWDSRDRTLHLARDRVGKKPLYYAHRGKELSFASTLPALLELLPQRPGINALAVDAYLVYQAVPAPTTIYAGVAHLLPGHEARYSAESGQLTVGRYWDVSYADKLALSSVEAMDETERLVRAAVQRRLISDVPLGTFLSAGVDSSLVTAIAAQCAGREIDAICLGFDEEGMDERPFAREVARRWGVRLHETVLRSDALDRLPTIVGQFGEPIADVSIVPTYCVAEAAKRHVTVVLNGDGGDELFGGYAVPVQVKAASLLRRSIPRVALRALRSASGILPRVLQEVVAASCESPDDAFVYNRGLGSVRGVAYGGLLADAVRRWDPDARYRTLWGSASAEDDVDRSLYAMFKAYLPDQLLVKMDAATMAHSVEARSPLLDTALIEFAARLPTAVRIPGFRTKPILKAVAARFVPREVVYRRKRGFIMPAGTWLGRDYRRHLTASLGHGAQVREYLNGAWLDALLGSNPSADAVAARRLWTIWMLELWLRMDSGRLSKSDSLDAVLQAPRVASGRPVEPPPSPGPSTPRAAALALQVGMGWFPEAHGGLNRVFYELVRRLPSQGFGVEGVVQAVGRPECGDGWSVRGLVRPGAPRGVRWMRHRALLGTALARRPWDVVVSHFAPSIWPAVREVRVPLVVHFHGPWADESRAEGAGPLRTYVAWHIERSVYQRGALFVVLSNAFGDILEQRYGVPRDRVRLVPGGVDIERFERRTTRQEARRLLPWPQDRPIVFVLRRLVRRMGLDNLVSAMESVRQRVPDVLAIIGGDGPLRAELEERIAASRLQDNVRLAGRLDDAALPLAYAAADVSVVPTVTLEGFGLAVVESLAAGTPVIGTPVGGIPEILRPLDEQLVCEDSSSAAIADRLIAVLLGRVRLPDAEACARYARTHYAWDVVAGRVGEVYREAMASR